MIKKRLILFTILALIGGFLFIPFSTSSSTDTSSLIWIVFPAGSALVVLLLGWWGLKLSDKTKLPMPILRKWENNEIIKSNDFKILILPAVLGAILALIIYLLNPYFNVPKNPGNLLERILTTPWAAVVPEIVSHLLAMSLIVLLLKNRWIAIILSSLIFVALFHLQSVEGELKTTIFLGAGNFTTFTLTGWFYSKYGFESAVIGHATMHLILLALN